MKDDILAGTVTCFISIIGLVTNSLVLWAVSSMSLMNNSFGLITKNQAVCNILMTLTFLCYIFPMEVTAEIPYYLEYSHVIGVFLMTLYEVSVASHLFIALNRLCTVFGSTRLETFFSIHTTKVIRNLLWLLSISFCTYLYELLGCFFEFNLEAGSMEFPPDCDRVTWYSDFILNTSLVFITLFINLITLYKSGKHSKTQVLVIGVKVSNRREKRRMSFVKQTVAQSTAIFIGQVSYYLFVPMLEDNILQFFFVSLWAYVHALEGVIILASNTDIYQFINGKFSNKKQERVATVGTRGDTSKGRV